MDMCKTGITSLTELVKSHSLGCINIILLIQDIPFKIIYGTNLFSSSKSFRASVCLRQQNPTECLSSLFLSVIYSSLSGLCSNSAQIAHRPIFWVLSDQGPALLDFPASTIFCLHCHVFASLSRSYINTILNVSPISCSILV